MTTTHLEIHGLDELLKALQDAPDKARPLVEEAMNNSLALLHDRLAGYPPTTEANQPGRYSLKTRKPMGYYERSRGWWYPVMKGTTLGEKRGKRRGAIKAPRGVMGVAGYKLRRSSKRLGTSERLGTKWKSQASIGDGWVYGEIGTTVSYADYVQGDRQDQIHAARGWETAGQALDESAEEIIGFFEDAADRLTKRLTEAK